MSVSSLKYILLVFLISCLSISGAAESFTVVIDAGHGGKDVGAVDNGVREKDINLTVAQKLGKLIKSKLKDVKVVFTRDNDTFLSLQERADKANKAKGDLFISIHTNSVDKANKNRTSVAGAQTYALGLHKEKSNMEVARRENAVIELEKNYEQKYSGFNPNSDESYIIFELAQKKNLSRSIGFADEVQKQFVAKGRRDRGVHQAGFWVLWATSMPAVLVELDFICNPNSAKYMASDQGSSELAEALFKAVDSYIKKVKKGGYKETAPSADKTSENATGVTLISASEKPPRKVTEAPAATSARRTQSSSRRRRSEASAAKSASQNFEKDNITVYTESPVKKQQVEIAASPKQQSPEPAATPQAEPSKKKTAKAQPGNKRAYNGKTVVVTASNASGRPRMAKTERLASVYKIQILVATEVLKDNDPQFRGLSPVSYFRQGNFYKYTYGESESKTEIDALLRQVKKLIPDAFVIRTTKEASLSK